MFSVSSKPSINVLVFYYFLNCLLPMNIITATTEYKILSAYVVKIIRRLSCVFNVSAKAPQYVVTYRHVSVKYAFI